MKDRAFSDNLSRRRCGEKRDLAGQPLHPLHSRRQCVGTVAKIFGDVARNLLVGFEHGQNIDQSEELHLQFLLCIDHSRSCPVRFEWENSFGFAPAMRAKTATNRFNLRFYLFVHLLQPLGRDNIAEEFGRHDAP